MSGSKSKAAISSIFDRKFGEGFLKGVPLCPGVYLYTNEKGEIRYVGKAKSLRRRLAQYRNAKKNRDDRKMGRIVHDAMKLEFVTCETELDALIMETRLIQQHRPRWNVAGAFAHIYPYFGVRRDGDVVEILFTTLPEAFPEHRLFGAFRSRGFCQDAFTTLAKLLGFWGHREKRTRVQVKARVKYSWVYRFRQLPTGVVDELQGWLRGETDTWLETLCLALLDNAGARRKSLEVQEGLKFLKAFWELEALPLKEVITACGHSGHPVAQKERDILFHQARFKALAKEPPPPL